MSTEQRTSEAPLTVMHMGAQYIRVDLYTQVVQERDLYKFQAETNAETIVDMVQSRARVTS